MCQEIKKVPQTRGRRRVRCIRCKELRDPKLVYKEQPKSTIPAGVCKYCVSKYYKGSNPLIKTCGSCGADKHIKAFSKASANWDGYSHRCRECANACTIAWRRKARGITDTARRCVGCGKTLPNIEFASAFVHGDVCFRQVCERCTQPDTYNPENPRDGIQCMYCGAPLSGNIALANADKRVCKTCTEYNRIQQAPTRARKGRQTLAARLINQQQQGLN